MCRKKYKLDLTDTLKSLKSGDEVFFTADEANTGSIRELARRIGKFKISSRNGDTTVVRL